MNDETPDIQISSSSGEASPQPDAGGEPRRRRKSAASSAPRQPRRRSRRASDTNSPIQLCLTTAFTHVSALKPPRKRGDSYQRLEFLGDHVLGLIVSDMLYRAFPNADEGEMSKRLADLVRKESCADVAKSLGLLDDIKLGAVGAGQAPACANPCSATSARR